MRQLLPTFMWKLKEGFLQPVLDLVKADSTLCLEIREKHVEIYYRGGVILDIKKKRDSFSAHFDGNHFKHSSTIRVPKKLPALLAGLDDFKKRIEAIRAGSDGVKKWIETILTGPDDVEKWIDAMPFLKHEMDLWFGENFREEREFQQLMVRENNFGNSAKSTDYFICDIEYQNSNRRFDLIAVHWQSTSKARKNNENLGLAFMEMKYLDKALTGKAGLKKHIEDANDFLGNQKNLEDIKDEMKNIFNQKLELGLINNKKPIDSFADEKPEYILALVNHDPAAKNLKKVLQTLTSYSHMDLKVVVSNFMGYGLYDESIYPLDDFLDRFEDQI